MRLRVTVLEGFPASCHSFSIDVSALVRLCSGHYAGLQDTWAKTRSHVPKPRSPLATTRFRCPKISSTARCSAQPFRAVLRGGWARWGQPHFLVTRMPVVGLHHRLRGQRRCFTLAPPALKNGRCLDSTRDDTVKLPPCGTRLYQTRPDIPTSSARRRCSRLSDRKWNVFQVR